MLVKIALKIAEMTCALLGETTELKSREPLGIGTEDAAVILKTVRYHTKRHGRNINAKSFCSK
jgi:hypothetical protein